jgi:hypothetical protein
VGFATLPGYVYLVKANRKAEELNSKAK